VKEFNGRVAVITGGASGIGRGLAERFAREGMKIVIGDIEQPALDQAVAELGQSGADCAGVRCDVSEYAEVERLAGAAYDKFGAVHILCNNAGVSSQAAPSWAQTEADWRWVLGVNLWGVIHGIRAFVPRMLDQASEGHIVNTASLAGLLSFPYGAPYNVSKFGVVALTEALHFELAIAQSKLKTSVLCPASVSTRILDSARNRPPELSNPREPQIDEAWAEAFRARLAEGLTPETVAERVFEAVRDEQLYIWTHPEYKPAVRMRMEEVVEGRNPDIEKKLGGLGREAMKPG
jgi:NAD(P)-dependent dehydrogenase (short-subunit alcohol dehydrogenase family)